MAEYEKAVRKILEKTNARLLGAARVTMTHGTALSRNAM